MSKYLTFSLIVIALIVGIMGGYFVAPKTAGSTAEKSPMQKLVKEMPTQEETGLYSDQQYLKDMIAHHEDAVEMSKKVLLHTSRKEVRELAGTIIEVQSKEISDMNQKLQEWQ